MGSVSKNSPLKSHCENPETQSSSGFCMMWQFLQMLPLESDLEEQQIREKLILDPLNTEGKNQYLIPLQKLVFALVAYVPLVL